MSKSVVAAKAPRQNEACDCANNDGRYRMALHEVLRVLGDDPQISLTDITRAFVNLFSRGIGNLGNLFAAALQCRRRLLNRACDSFPKSILFLSAACRTTSFAVSRTSAVASEMFFIIFAAVPEAESSMIASFSLLLDSSALSTKYRRCGGGCMDGPCQRDTGSCEVKNHGAWLVTISAISEKSGAVVLRRCNRQSVIYENIDAGPALHSP